MVTIIKDNTTKRVTTGQYENLFKKLGYKLVNEEVIEEKPKKKGEKNNALQNK